MKLPIRYKEGLPTTMELTFEGSVAFVTGAARGQGRSHALSLANSGVSVVLVDLCESLPTVPYSLSTRDDLEETAALIKAAGVDVLPIVADVRRLNSMEAAVEQAVATFGRIDYLVANAGIWSNGGSTQTIPKSTWDEMIDVNLTGVWHSLKAVVPHMVKAKRGRIVATCSSVVRHTDPNTAHYSAAKSGVFSLVKSVAIEQAHLGITANAVSPSNVGTDMILNDEIYGLYRPDLDKPTFEDAQSAYASVHAMGIPFIQPNDVSNAVSFLLSDQSKFITGIELPVTFGRTGGI